MALRLWLTSEDKDETDKNGPFFFYLEHRAAANESNKACWLIFRFSSDSFGVSSSV